MWRYWKTRTWVDREGIASGEARVVDRPEARARKRFGSMTTCIIVYANFGTMSDQGAYDLNPEVKTNHAPIWDFARVPVGGLGVVSP